MNIVWIIDSAFIFLGVCILAFSIVTTSRIINELQLGTLKGRWTVLRLAICLFIAGYIGYWIYLPRLPNFESLIVSFVFIAGAIFVLGVSSLMLQTTRDIKRVSSLELQSITDPLLGIFNRRYLDVRLTEEIARARRYKLPLSLLMLDIDHFKQVNDRFGHQVGDAVLILIGSTLKENARKSDIVARYGGEEIVIVLPNTLEEDAIRLAERTRRIVENLSYSVDGADLNSLHCTVSIGVASVKTEEINLAGLLHMADIAMYRAKQNGRNRIEAYLPGYEDDSNK